MLPELGDRVPGQVQPECQSADLVVDDPTNGPDLHRVMLDLPSTLILTSLNLPVEIVTEQ